MKNSIRTYLYYLRKIIFPFYLAIILFVYWVGGETLWHYISALRLSDSIDFASFILSSIFRTLLFFAAVALLAYALRRWPISYLLTKLPLGVIEKWDAALSVSHSQYRNPETAVRAGLFLSVASSLLLLWLTIGSMLDNWLAIATPILVGLSLIASAFNVYSVFHSEVKVVYYPHTGEFFEFYLETMADWGAKADEMYQAISPENPDYPVAQYLYAMHHNQPGNKPFHFDSFSAGDPRIQYGPLTEQQHKEETQAFVNYINHEVRMG